MPVFVNAATLRIAHDLLVGRHGGLPGVADLGRLDSVLQRPIDHLMYGDPQADLHDLAAVTAVAVARGHVFADANKRTAWYAFRHFLRRNEVAVVPVPAATVIEMVQAIAAGSLSAEAFAQAFRPLRRPHHVWREKPVLHGGEG